MNTQTQDIAASTEQSRMAACPRTLGGRRELIGTEAADDENACGLEGVLQRVAAWSQPIRRYARGPGRLRVRRGCTRRVASTWCASKRFRSRRAHAPRSDRQSTGGQVGELAGGRPELDIVGLGILVQQRRALVRHGLLPCQPRSPSSSGR